MKLQSTIQLYIIQDDASFFHDKRINNPRFSSEDVFIRLMPNPDRLAWSAIEAFSRMMNDIDKPYST